MEIRPEVFLLARLFQVLLPEVVELQLLVALPPHLFQVLLLQAVEASHMVGMPMSRNDQLYLNRITSKSVNVSAEVVFVAWMPRINQKSPLVTPYQVGVCEETHRNSMNLHVHLTLS